MHYVYPYPHVDDVIPLMAEGRVLPYLDMPFQHGSPSVLKRMRAPRTRRTPRRASARWRARCPDLTMRSTFIVGFPGETDAEFDELLAWLDEAQLDRVGASSIRRSKAPPPTRCAGHVSRGSEGGAAGALHGTRQRDQCGAPARRVGQRCACWSMRSTGHGHRAQRRRCAGDRRRGADRARVKITGADAYDLKATPLA
jgi:tRNA A37 methylthiotransferase MiaB